MWLGAPEREWGQVLQQLKEAENLRKVTVCAEKTHNHSHFGFVTPTVLQSGSGGDRSCSFIAVEERTRKMLTAFMRCGINNNRLGFIAFYSLLKSLQPFLGAGYPANSLHTIVKPLSIIRKLIIKALNMTTSFV